MIGYSGIYSPNNKKNQESIAIRLVYSQNSEIENHVITNAWHFPAFLYQTAIYVLLR